MTTRLRLFSKRGRRRMARRPEDATEVFKAFVHALSQMHANGRSGSPASLSEKNG